jgi:hypothetical protein
MRSYPNQYCQTPFAPQGFHVQWNAVAAWILPVFGTIELLGDEPSIPGQDGVRLGNAGDLSERFAPHTPADLGESAALGINQPQSRWQLGVRIRFSASKYSSCSRSSWFTDPVTHASSRTHLLFLMPTAHLTLAPLRAC